MKQSIKIIRRKKDEDSKELNTFEAGTSVERSTREMAKTVKCWMAEFQQRKEVRAYELSRRTRGED